MTFKTTVPQIPAAPQLEAFDLFPTRIWQANLAPLTTRHPDWIAYITQLRNQHPAPAGRTLRCGWNSSDFSLLDTPIFAELKDSITSQIRAALNQMGEADLPIALQAWVNLQERGGFNYAHAHEGCYLSGCYYLQVPAGSGALVFRDPRPGPAHNAFKGDGANAYRDIRLAPYAGLLVLFPNWLEHYVEPHDSADTRVAIAFNAVPNSHVQFKPARPRL